jgi:branched-chain amino acid transport system permease protein
MLGVLLSTQIVLYVLFGGVGTLVGAVIGVASIEYVSFLLADNFQTFWPILLGLLLLFVVLFRRSGLVGLVVTERERFGRFGRAPARTEVGRGHGTA